MRNICLAAAMLLSLAASARGEGETANPAKLQGVWPSGLPAIAVRVGRPADDLAAIRRFYGEGLGLRIIADFEDHASFSGVVFGIPGGAYQLEFTRERDKKIGKAPTDDNNLVFYVPNPEAVKAMAAKLTGLGYREVEAVNPYWTGYGARTIEDPDGWRVVLMPAIPNMLR